MIHSVTELIPEFHKTCNVVQDIQGRPSTNTSMEPRKYLLKSPSMDVTADDGNEVSNKRNLGDDDRENEKVSFPLK